MFTDRDGVFARPRWGNFNPGGGLSVTEYLPRQEKRRDLNPLPRINFMPRSVHCITSDRGSACILNVRFATFAATLWRQSPATIWWHDQEERRCPVIGWVGKRSRPKSHSHRGSEIGQLKPACLVRVRLSTTKPQPMLSDWAMPR